MRPENGGARIGIVFNGSPMFSRFLQRHPSGRGRSRNPSASRPTRLMQRCRVFSVPAHALEDDEGMEAVKPEGVHSWLAGSDCGLRHLKPHPRQCNKCNSARTTMIFLQLRKTAVCGAVGPGAMTKATRAWPSASGTTRVTGATLSVFG